MRFECARKVLSRTYRSQFGFPTCAIRAGRPLISKSWTDNARSLPLNSHSRRRVEPNTRVSCSFTGPLAEAGSNYLFRNPVRACGSGEWHSQQVDTFDAHSSIGPECGELKDSTDGSNRGDWRECGSRIKR